MGKVVEKDIEVRWADLDAQNHVNNTAFLVYLEEIRLVLFKQLDGNWQERSSAPVVVNININYRREIRYPATVSIRLEAHVASEKRLVLNHSFTDRDDPDTLYADAELTVVWMDQNTRRAIALPASVRDTIGT